MLSPTNSLTPFIISFRYGLLFSPVGLAIGIFLTLTAPGDGYWQFILAAPLAGIITGTVLWRWIVEPARKDIPPRIILTAFLTGTLSHWVCWYLLLFSGWILNALNGWKNPVMNPVQAVVAAAGYSLFSLLFFGLFTVGWALATAVILKYFLQKNNKKDAETSF